jgi:hypothetical protein
LKVWCIAGGVEDLHVRVRVDGQGVGAGYVDDVDSDRPVHLAGGCRAAGGHTRAKSRQVSGNERQRGSVDGEFAGQVLTDRHVDPGVGGDEGHSS